MIIRSVAASFPSRTVTNEEVVSLIEQKSKGVFRGDLPKTLKRIKAILKKTGAQTRYWSDKNRERPIDHIIESAKKAINSAGIKRTDIDLLIYTGIGKGFIEPANAYLVAQVLGMENVRCFDITDACMSWITALHISDSLFKTTSYKNILIVNAEFTVQYGSLLSNFTMRNEQQLRYSFPAFTVGEAATATLLSNTDSKSLTIEFSSFPKLANRCIIPLPEFEGYCNLQDGFSHNGPLCFTSYGIDLHDKAAIEAPNTFHKLQSKGVNTNIDIVFSHSSSKTDWHKYARKVGIADKLYPIYHETGNLVSASIPAAMSMAISQDKLRRSNDVVVWVGSAGMSFATAKFSY